MPSLSELLHAARFRPFWRALLVSTMLAVCWLALSPKPPTLPFGQTDKFEHALAFAVLTVAAFLAGRGGRRGAGIAALAMFGFGCFIELAQTQVPGRSAEWADLAANASGIVIGLLLAAGARLGVPARD
jgi:VanZ family protein